MKVRLMTGHFLIESKDGELRVNFDELTAEQEDTLRSLVVVKPIRDRAKRRARRESGKPRSGANYAALVCGRDVAGVNENEL